MPLVKPVWVKVKVDGAAEARAAMADLAARGRALEDMDPTIKVKVDTDAIHKLAAMRAELSALTGAKDIEGLKNLAGRLRALGDGSESARVKLRALNLELAAARSIERAMAADAAKAARDAGGGAIPGLSGLPGPLGALGSASWP